MTQLKEDIVISGIGGKFPECDNLDEFKELLFKKVNAVTSNEQNASISTEQLIYSYFFLLLCNFKIHIYYNRWDGKN